VAAALMARMAPIAGRVLVDGAAVVMASSLDPTDEDLSAGTPDVGHPFLTDQPKAKSLFVLGLEFLVSPIQLVSY